MSTQVLVIWSLARTECNIFINFTNLCWFLDFFSLFSVFFRSFFQSFFQSFFWRQNKNLLWDFASFNSELIFTILSMGSSAYWPTFLAWVEMYNVLKMAITATWILTISRKNNWYRLFFLRSIAQFFTQIYMNRFVSS